MTFFLGTSTAFVLLPSSVNKEMISSWFSLGKTTSHISEDSANPSDNSIKSSITPGVAVVHTDPLPLCHFDNPPLVDIVADQLGLQWNFAGCPIYA